MIGEYFRWERMPTTATTVELWGWVHYRVYPNATWIEYPRR